VHIATIWLEEC